MRGPPSPLAPPQEKTFATPRLLFHLVQRRFGIVDPSVRISQARFKAIRYSKFNSKHGVAFAI